jgi:MFS family permease
MLFRFSLYGFLKNQRYFEPFLVLAFLEKGLGFFEIGLLIAFRELTVNLLEIPSGAIADVWGRRRSMMLSFSAYIVSFLTFGWGEHLALLFVGMFFFAIGDAFRTGTHKAMIFQWLRLEGRIDERTRVYGFTRSWSKLGSAVSVLLAALFVLLTDSYVSIFYFATIPYVLSIVNFLGYPQELEGSSKRPRTPAETWSLLRAALTQAWSKKGLRGLMFESMGYEGVFHAVKDYLQPMIQAVALASWGAAIAWSFGEAQETALLIGPVYFVIYLLAAAASRQAHRLADTAGSEDRAARWLWGGTFFLFVLITAAAWYEVHALLIVAFGSLHVLQNFWRPILITRIDARGDESQGATLLSIESQSRRLVTMVTAPLLGLAVDLVSSHGLGGPFWPVGLLGLFVSAIFLSRSRTSP